MKYYVEFQGEYSAGFSVEAANSESAIEKARAAAMGTIDATIESGQYQCMAIESNA